MTARREPLRSQYPGSTVEPALLVARRRFLQSDGLGVLTTRSNHEVFETAVAAPAEAPLALRGAGRDLDFTYGFLDVEHRAAEFAQRTFTSALIVLRGDRVLHERYLCRSTPASSFQSSSMSKAVVAILAGIAIGDGAIGSVEDRAATYLPELRGTVYEDTTLDHLLSMRTGVVWDDAFWLEGQAQLIQELSLFANVARYTEAAQWLTERDREPGTVFRYNSLESALVSRVVAEAVGTSLTAYTQDRLWGPAGMERPAIWLLDGPPGVGHEFAAGGFNACLRDYARLGLLMLRDGCRDDQRILPEGWVARATHADEAGKQPWGFGYNWWPIPGTREYAAIGGGGQYVYVDAATDTVVVKLSFVPRDAEERLYGRTLDEITLPLDGETLAFCRAASQWAG